MEALVSSYLRETPSNDLEKFELQFTKASWLEKRFFENIVNLFNNK